jgi:alkylation response protein AidB-like acyl-CoA dehydrogenase
VNITEFRSGLRAWLDGHDLSAGADQSLDARVAQLGRVRRELYDAGWMRYGWPAEAGGLGGPAVLRAVLGEEVAARDLAEPGIYSLVEVLAPAVIAYAPALAAQLVPRLLNGSEQWCQGFSEPGAGSDLAALATRATPADRGRAGGGGAGGGGAGGGGAGGGGAGGGGGGDWVISGQKLWTSLAQYAARCLVLARTGPGRDGITAFFVDMDSPGVSVRPLRAMHGADEFAEVFFDDVLVPGDRVLGRPGDGWRLAMDLLPHERSTCFWHRIAYLYGRLDRLLAQAGPAAAADPGLNGTGPGGTRPGDDRLGDDRLGAAYLALHVARCRSRATQRRMAEGGRLGAETSVDKVLLASAEQVLYDTVRDLLPGVLELTGSPWRAEYLFSRAATIYGGTAEIQRNIIARRLLDLGKE